MTRKTTSTEVPSSEGVSTDPGRRRFLRSGLRSGAAFGLAATLSPAALLGCRSEGETLPDGTPSGNSTNASPSSRPGPGPRRRFGKAGFEIPPVSFGTFSLRASEDDLRLVRTALDRGITHFDTADSYGDGSAESTLGRALKADRARVTITTKTAARPDARADELMRGLDESLRRLQSETIDLYMNHAVDSFDRLRNPEWAEFVARAKAAGKIRAAGMSGHGPSLVPVLREAIETEWIDAVLVAYNYIQSPSFLSQAKIRLQEITGRLDWVALQPELPAVLAEAKRRDLGVMTMKTLRGARHNDLRPYERDGSTFAQAAIRWVLAQEDVDGLVITMRDVGQVDEFVAAHAGPGGGPRRPEDLALLVGYESLNYARQCVQGCGDCADLCPSGVPIAETLRFGMYARDYGEPERAAQQYEARGSLASACLDCSGAPCADACPSGVAIPEELREAHTRLTS